MPGETYTLKNPKLVRDRVLARCMEKGVDRAALKSFQMPDWDKPLGTWTYDKINAAREPTTLVRTQFRRLSMALGWEADAIFRIDDGLEPVELTQGPSSESAQLRQELMEVRQVVANLAEAMSRFERLIDEAEDPAGPGAC